MQVTAFLAESVDVANGKLFAHAAGWSTVNTPRLPAVIPRLGIGIILHPEPHETAAELVLRVRLFDSSDNACPFEAARVEGCDPPGTSDDVEVALKVDPQEDTLVVLSLTCDNLVLPRAERYHFVVGIDGSTQTSFPLQVVVTTPRSEATGDHSVEGE